MTSEVLSVYMAFFPARRNIVMPGFVLPVFVFFYIFFNGMSAFSQSLEKLPATKVAVAEVTMNTISDVSELQGRLVGGAVEAVTAVISAEIKILDLQLGDTVSNGQNIAK